MAVAVLTMVTEVRSLQSRGPSSSIEAKETQAQLGALSVEELMAAYVGGQVTAFDELYRRVAPTLFGFLLRLTRKRDRAEDLLQVTFSKIHRARASYLLGAPFLPWALAIARRSFYDEVRSAKSRREELSYDGQLPEPKGTQESTLELAKTLEQALNQLPADYREAIQLTKIIGLSVAEAAAIVGTTPTALKLRVHRGYKTLRTLLDSNSDPSASRDVTKEP